METRDVDAPPNFPPLGMLVAVQTNTISTANRENVWVVNNAGTTVPVGPEGLDSDHVPGVHRAFSAAPRQMRSLWITAASVKWLWRGVRRWLKPVNLSGFWCWETSVGRTLTREWACRLSNSHVNPLIGAWAAPPSNAIGG